MFDIYYKNYDKDFIIVKGDKEKYSNLLCLLKGKWRDDLNGWLVNKKYKKQVEKIINTTNRNKKYHREQSGSEGEEDIRKIYVSSSSEQSSSCNSDSFYSSSEDIFVPSNSEKENYEENLNNDYIIKDLSKRISTLELKVEKLIYNSNKKN